MATDDSVPSNTNDESAFASAIRRATTDLSGVRGALLALGTVLAAYVGLVAVPGRFCRHDLN
jgi:hypothetical protein